MKPNPLPFVFLPGVVLVGYLVGEWPGVAWALAAWGAVVLLGTLLSLRRHLAARREALRDATRFEFEPALHLDEADFRLP